MFLFNFLHELLMSLIILLTSSKDITVFYILADLTVSKRPKNSYSTEIHLPVFNNLTSIFLFET